MELKKSPKANLEGKRLTYVLVGLVVALSLLYVAFEWTQSDIVVAEITDDYVLDGEEELDAENTLQEEEEVPPEPEPEEIPEEEQIIEELTIVDDNKETQHINVSSEDKGDAVKVVAAPVNLEEEEEEDEQIFMIVEQNPEFPGGSEGLNKYFQSNIRYPLKAQELGIQGKVFCQFTVRKDGTVGDVEVLRSSGDATLDAEAVRLVSKMPKWTPGKQQGKAVHCKFRVPVTFRIAR